MPGPQNLSVAEHLVPVIPPHHFTINNHHFAERNSLNPMQQGDATTMPQPYAYAIPQAHYRCEGADLGTEEVAEIHFREETGGFFRPQDLFHHRIVDKKNELECSGFFCESCLEAYGLKTKGKTTLRDAITTKLQALHQDSLKAIAKAAGV